MFKIGSSENEIMQSMEKLLIEKSNHNEYDSKLSRAANYLAQASIILKSANLIEEAEELNNLAKSLKG